MADNVLETVVELRDNYSKNAKQIGKASQDMADSVRKSGTAFSSQRKHMSNLGVDINAVNRKVTSLSKELTAITGKNISITANPKVNFSTILKAKSEAKTLEKELQAMTGKKYKVDLGLEGGALSAIKGGLKGGLLAAGAGAVAGVGQMWSLGSQRQQNKVAMTHFLGGDENAANEMMQWASDNARTTQYSEGEVQSAARRAVQVSEGDIAQAQQLTQLAEDMASLTPGKTIDDAMEALADMQMGEMERMKEFGFKSSKEEFDAAGGDITKVKSTSGKNIMDMFAGGTAEGGATAGAKMGTIMGTFEGAIANAGEKMQTAFAPALDWAVQKAEEWAPSVENFLTGAINTATNLGAALQPFTPLLSGIATVVGGVLKIAFSTVGTVLNNLVIPAIKWVGEKLQPTFEKLKAQAIIVAESFKKGKRHIDNFVQAVKDAPSKMFDWVKSHFHFGSSGGGGGKKSGKSSKKSATGSWGFRSNGGWTQMNEGGRGEMVKLPSGTKIYPYRTTMQMLKKEAASTKRINNNNVVVNIDARNSNLSESQVHKLKTDIVDGIIEALDNAVPA